MPLFILENRLQELIFKNFRFPRKFLKFGKKKKRWGIKMTEVTSGGSPPPEERRERRVGRGVSKVMDANPDRGGRVRRNATRGERCVGVGGGREATSRYRGSRSISPAEAAREVGRPLLSALVATGHRSPRPGSTAQPRPLFTPF